MNDADAADALAEAVRCDWGRLTALLVRRTGRVDLAADALADACEAAVRTWPRDGRPTNPTGWLMTVASRRLIDALRAENTARSRSDELLRQAEDTEHRHSRRMDEQIVFVDDDLLRLVLMCAHPCLERDAACALSLRLVLGVPTVDIARLLLVPQATMAARLTRAKRKLVELAVASDVSGPQELTDRLDVVAQVAYLAFTAGYVPGPGTDLMRPELSGEAIRLVRVVLGLRPNEPVFVALLALMLLQHARRDARVVDGTLVLLADQDRSRWHHDEIAEGLGLLDHPALASPLSAIAASYLLQAHIAAEHARTASVDDTDWSRIVRRYDELLKVAPSPAARLARAVAVAEADGAVAGLAALEELDLPSTHRISTVRAELLRRSGDLRSARTAYDEAIAHCDNAVERAHLESSRAELAE